MTQTAFDRDGILSPEERVTSARKCLSILSDASSEHLRMRDYEFLLSHRTRAKSIGYGVSERELAWLRDLVSKYAA